ncbi:MAG: DoxX family protein [Bryobacteraceae bacterium]
MSKKKSPPPGGSNFSHDGWVIFLVRISAGLLMFFLHGLGKLSGAAGYLRGHKWAMIDAVGSLGFPLPGLFALLSTGAEAIAALFLALGLFTRMSAWMLAINMLVACWSHVSRGETPEMALLYLVAAVAVARLGPGKLALDSFRG